VWELSAQLRLAEIWGDAKVNPRPQKKVEELWRHSMPLSILKLEGHFYLQRRAQVTN